MKVKTIIAIILLFSLNISFGQTNEITIGGLFIKDGNEYIAGGVINYYKHIGNSRAIGIKSNIIFLTTSSDFEVNYLNNTKERLRYNIPSLLSLVYKYDFYKYKKSTFSLDGGPIAYADIKYNKKEYPIGKCGVGLPNNYRPEKAEFKHWLVDLYFGISSSLNFSYSIIQKLNIGLNIQAMAFFNIQKSDSYPVMLPTLWLSYKFGKSQL